MKQPSFANSALVFENLYYEIKACGYVDILLFPEKIRRSSAILFEHWCYLTGIFRFCHCCWIQSESWSLEYCVKKLKACPLKRGVFPNM